MLQINNVSKAYGDRVLLDGVSMAMGRGERLGLLGRNGSGKSTLFRMILDQEHPDSGSISVPRGYQIGHLAQHLHFAEANIVQEVCLGLPVEERGEEYRAKIMLAGLGFQENDMDLPASKFSGGFQIRVNLARLLISTPNLLLLDEPTNYLDIVSVRWLIQHFKEWPFEMIVISHDRDFLDQVTTHSAVIHRGGIRKIKGSSSKLYEQIAVDEEVYEKTRVNDEKKKKEMQVFIDRFRAKASKAASVQSRIKALEKMGTKDELQDEQVLDFNFSEAPQFYGKFLAEISDLGFQYPQEKSAHGVAPRLIENLSFSIKPGERIGVVGKNGRGKSTLLKLLAGELAPSSGSVKLHAAVQLGFFGQTNINRLNLAMSVVDEIRDANDQLSTTRLRGICGAMMFSGDDALKKIKILSGGERSRVLLGRILACPSNLLLLDEPTNHLDMESIEALIDSIKEYAGAVVIVTHSELILRSLATKLIVFQEAGPVPFDGGYEQFLDSVGWEEEGGGIKDIPSQSFKRAQEESPAYAPAKELTKQERAELIQEKSRVLKPLKNSIDTLEKEITVLEKRIATENENIIRASEAGDGKLIAESSKFVAAMKKRIDEAFEELSAATRQHDQEKERFDQLLN